jgi:hypothetical protein
VTGSAKGSSVFKRIVAFVPFLVGTVEKKQQLALFQDSEEFVHRFIDYDFWFLIFFLEIEHLDQMIIHQT